MRSLILFVAACGFRGPPELGPHDGGPIVIDAPDHLIPDAAVADGTTQLDASAIPDAPAITLDAGADAPPAFSCMSNPAPKACFLFDNNTSDSSGNNVPLQVTAGTPTYAAGVNGQAIVLDTTDQLAIPSSSANLVTAAAIALGEGLRQTDGFPTQR